MSGETNRKKRVKALKHFIIILLASLMLVPCIICIVLMVRVVKLQEEVYLLKAAFETVSVQGVAGTDTNDINPETVEIPLAQAASNAEGEVQRVEEDSAQENADALENQIIWDNIAQNARPWDSNSGIRKVYLTFDDGPSANTDKILDILNEYGVKATFFVVGKEGFNQQYQRIAEEGHTLGMHSYSHKYREIYQSLDAYKADLQKLRSYLYELTGEECDIVRFPGGSSNTISKVDMQELITYLKEEDMAYYDWNVSSGDAASGYISAEQIANNVLNNVWKYDSVIILMHDSSAKDTTVQALPIIIEKILEDENTVLLPISEDTIPIQHVQAECQ